MEPLDQAANNAIQKMSQVELTREMLEMADMEGFVQKVTFTFSKLEKVGARMDKISRASLFMKLIYKVTGETGQTQQDAMKLYGEVLQWVVQLSAVNTVLAKKISDQQMETGRLTERILDQAKLQEQQDQKHYKELADLKKRHEELHRLIENQNKLLEILPALRMEMDSLTAKFQGYDVFGKELERKVGETQGLTEGVRDAQDKERERREALGRKLHKIIVALAALSILTVAGFIYLSLKIH